MTLVMSYVILLAAAIGACGAALDGMLAHKTPRRWIWLSSLALTLAATVVAMIWPVAVPDSAVSGVIGSSTLVLSEPTTSSVSTSPTDHSLDILSAADAMLPFAWLLTSAGLLLAIAFGQRRLRRERLGAHATELAGHPVLITGAIGPAVAGLRSPVVFVPQWVLALDEPSQRLLMAHEMEHVRKRDTAMLFAGALGAALVPWNPMVWWMVRRLRLAVEQDCDARVLARYPEVRRYADLLLMAASRPGLTARLLAAHFGEDTSDLLRRIDAMTRRQIPLRTLVASALAAVALLAAACETPRPAPVAPLSIREAAPFEAAGESAAWSTEFSEQVVRCTKDGGAGCQISVIVQSSDLKTLARYHGEIPVSHLPEGWVDRIKVEEATCGNNSCSLIWITLKPGRLILQGKARPDEIEPKLIASRDTIWSEITAVERRSQVPEYVEVKKGPPHFHFDSKSPNAVEVPATYTEQSGERMARGQGMVRWPAWTRNEAPNIVILSNDRTELRRVLSADVHKNGVNAFDEILPADVAALEYHGGKAGCVPLDCPLVKVIIRPGREAAYKR